MRFGWRRVKSLLYKDYLLVAAEKNLRLRKDDIVVDVGGGGGYYIKRLAGQAGCAVILDQFAGAYVESMKLAKVVAETEGSIHVIVADAHGMPLRSSSVSKILANQILEHLSTPQEFFKEVGRVLLPRGRMIVMSQNASFLTNYSFPVRRLLKRALPFRCINNNAFLVDGYEAWEKAVGHLHRFTAGAYQRMARENDLRVTRIFTVHGRLSFAVWEIENSFSQIPRLGYPVRVFCRAILLPICRAFERFIHEDGVDLIGVFEKTSSSEV